MSTTISHRLISPVLAVLLSSIGMQAQAAGWSLLPGAAAFDLSEQLVEVNGQAHGQTVLGGLQDLSTGGAWLTSTAQSHAEASTAGTLSYGHEGTLSVEASGGATANVLLSASQYLQLDPGGPASISSIAWTQDVAVTDLRLQINGQGGEAPGQRVAVSFEGLADVLYGGEAASALGLFGESQLDLSFSRNGQVLSSVSVNANGTLSRVMSLSFEAVVGDVIDVTLAAHHVLSQTGSVDWPGLQGLSLDRSAFLQGSLLVTAVPEADLAWLLLGGALVLSTALRGRRILQ